LYIRTARAKRNDQSSSHRVFVQIKGRLHSLGVRFGFVTEPKKIGCFRFEFAIDLIPIGVIVGEGCVDLSKIDVRIFFDNFFCC